MCSKELVTDSALVLSSALAPDVRGKCACFSELMRWFPLSVLCLTLDLIFEAASAGALVYFRDEHREFNKKQLDNISNNM